MYRDLRRLRPFGSRWPQPIIGAAAFLSLPGGAQAQETAAFATVHSVDLVWVMTAAALVMMMQVGFLLLEAGMVRSKNSINVAQKNLLDFVFGVVAFAAVGFMIAFGASSWLPIGIDGDYFLLRSIDDWEAGFFVFQVMFCGTAATIVSGAVAERMKLVAYVIGSLVLSALIYPIFVHWALGGCAGAQFRRLPRQSRLRRFRRLDRGAFHRRVDFACGLHRHRTAPWTLRRQRSPGADRRS